MTVVNPADSAADKGAFHVRPLASASNRMIGKARALSGGLHAAHGVSVDILQDEAENTLRDIGEVHLNTEVGGK